MMRRAAAVFCLVALAITGCSSDGGNVVGGGPQQYEEPPNFQQQEGRDWKILSPVRTDLLAASADTTATVPVTFRFSSKFVKYECAMTLGVQWLPLDGSASPRLAVVDGRPITETSLVLDVPAWPAEPDRADVAGNTAEVRLEARFVCSTGGLDFHASHTFRSSYPALGG